MAREIIVKVKLDSKQAQQDAEELNRKVTRGFDQSRDSVARFTKSAESATLGIKSMRSALSEASLAFAAFGIAGVAALKQIGEAAVRAAINIDRQVNTLKALTGSAVEAQRRFAELIALAQKTPGLTSNLALTLDTNLRILNVTEQTINRLLPVIGRLNAISPLGDPRQFVANLSQLITQGFERQDLKELVGNSPFAGELIKEVFNVDSPTNAKAIREAAAKLGIKTFEDFANAFAKTAENNPALQAVTESLGTRFEKLRDRIELAIAPVGEQIAKTLLPAFEDLVKAVEKYGAEASAVFRENKNDIIAATQQITKMVIEIGKATGALGRLAVKLQIPEFLGRAAAETQDIIADPFGQLNPFTPSAKGPKLLEFERELARIEAERKLPRLSTEPSVLSGLAETTKGFADFLGTGKGKSTSGGRAVISGGAAGRSRRDRFIDDFGLGQTALLEHEIEQARIREANRAVVERRERERLLAERPEQVARFNAAQADRVRAIERETAQLEENTRKQAAEDALRFARRDLTRSGRFIGAAVDRGQLTAGEAELLRQGTAGDFANQLREVVEQEEQLKKIRPEALEDLRDEIALYDQLSVSISHTERFMRGFNSQVGSVGDAFESFGQNVSRAFTNIKDLFGGLKQAVLQFFNDLVGQSLQNLVRSTLGSLFGNIGGALGGVFGGGAGGAGGGIGGLFRTPSTFPNALASAFAGAGGGGGISAPPSLSLPIPGLGGLSSIFSGSGAARSATRSGIDDFFGASVPRTAGSIAAKFSFSAIGKSLAAAAPLLGLSLGGGIGGQSVGGQILGSAGGLLGGLVLGASTGAIGGGLGSAFALSGALGPAALIAAPLLLVGGFLLGKAKQRRQDEEAAGQLLGQAFQAVEQLAAGIAADQIDGGQARAILESQIVGPFVQQINSLKTASVRRDWVKNQVPEIRARFEANVVPLIAAQERRRTDAARFAAIDSRLIPQFAIGGTVPGIDRGRDSVMAMLRPGEKVLTLAQQASVISQSNPSVFDRAGVPRSAIQVGAAQAFQFGGTAQPSGSSGVTLYVQFGMSDSDARQILARAVDSRSGKDIVVDVIQQARDGGRRV